MSLITISSILRQPAGCGISITSYGIVFGTRIQTRASKIMAAIPAAIVNHRRVWIPSNLTAVHFSFGFPLLLVVPVCRIAIIIVNRQCSIVNPQYPFPNSNFAVEGNLSSWAEFIRGSDLSSHPIPGSCTNCPKMLRIKNHNSRIRKGLSIFHGSKNSKIVKALFVRNLRKISNPFDLVPDEDMEGRISDPRCPQTIPGIKRYLVCFM